MASLFISYSRKDIEFARKLTESFNSRNLDFWIDWKGIPPSVNWWKEIEKGIEEADIFLFLISPDSCNSKICKQEIDHAIRNGKRLIPLVVRDITGNEAPAELGGLNWIFFRPVDEFNGSFSKLMLAIHTDFAWVQTHRQLQMKALEWERNNYESSFLLRGKELQDAESDLVRHSSKEPNPTGLQQDYLLKSKQIAERQRRQITIITVAGLLTLVGLTFLALVQAGRATQNAELANNNAATAQAASTLAVEQQTTAVAGFKEIQNQLQIIQSGNLASQSVAARNRDASLSLLLSVEALNVRSTDQSRSILMDNVYAKQELSPYQILNNGYGYNSIALSPDGKLLASGDAGGNITLWNVELGQPERQPLNDGREGYINSIAFNPNGKTLVAVYNKLFDNSLVLWNVETGISTDVPLTIFPVHAAFSPNGKLLAIGGSDGLILWDVEMEKPAEKQLDISTFYISDFAFSPDGKMLAIPMPDNSIIVWNIETGQQITQLNSPYYARILTFSPDGKILAADDDYTVLWDTTTWQMIGQPLAHGSIGYSLYNITFSPDSRILATPDGDGGVLLWDVKTGQIIVQPLLHRYNDIFTSITGIIFSLDGKNLFTSGLDAYGIALWDVSRLNAIPVQPIIQQIFASGERSVWDIELSPDGKILATNSVDDNFAGNINLWDTETALPIGEPFNSLASEAVLAFSPDGKILAIGEENGVLLRSVETGQTIGHLPDVQGNFTFSHDGMMLVVGSTYGVTLWDVQKKHLIDQLNTTDLDYYSDIVFSPDDKTIIASSLYGSLGLWDLATQQPLMQIVNQNASDSISGTALSPDGRIVAWINSSLQDHAIILWDIKTGQRIGQPLNGNSGVVKSIKFSPDGKTLVSGYENGTIILWGVETGLRIGQPLISPTGDVNHIAFSSNGKILATLGRKDLKVDVITLWDMDPESWIQKACQLAGKNFTRSEWAQFFPDEGYRKTCPQWPLDSDVPVTPTAAP
jgi:WD40 repeat protein